METQIIDLDKMSKRIHHGAGRPASSEVASRVEHLLDIATAVFLQQGYDNAIVGETAARAGASKATIYSRYPTKADLFVAVISREAHKLQMGNAEKLVEGDPLKKVLEEYGIRLIQAVSHPEFRALYKVFVGASAKFPVPASKFWDAVPQRSIAMLRDYLTGHPEFRGGQAEHAAEMFWSFCCGQPVLRALLHEEDSMSEEEIHSKVKEATRILLAAFT